MTVRHILFLFLLCVSAGSCGSWGDGEDDTPIVVAFKDEVLRQGELASRVPEGLSEKDSIFYAEFYIEQWIHEQAVADAALSKITDLEQKIEHKVRDYRRKLIVHEYTNYLVANKLDTNVDEQELREFYGREKENFPSKEDLYNYFFIVSPVEESRSIREWLKSEDAWAADSARNWAALPGNADIVKLDSQYADASTLNEMGKGYFGDLKKSKIGQLIRWTGVIHGMRKRYYFRLIDVILPGEPMPYGLIKDELRTILLNERKFDIIRREEDRIVNEAKAKKIISRN